VPFTPSPLRLNIFRLFVILSLTQLYRYTPEIFLTATFKYKYRASLSRIGQEYSAKVAFPIFQSMKRIQPLPVCAGFFICIRNSLDRPCVTMIFEFAFKVGRLHVLGYFALLYSNISFQSKDVTCVMFLLLVIYAYKVTNREYRRGNQKLTIQRNWQHRVHKTKTNKTKSQHNMH
jgi:hypothetical protein